MPNFSESILFIIIIQVGTQGKKLLGNIGFSLCFIIKIFLLTIQERRRKIRNRWTEYVQCIYIKNMKYPICGCTVVCCVSGT